MSVYVSATVFNSYDGVLQHVIVIYSTITTVYTYQQMVTFDLPNSHKHIISQTRTSRWMTNSEYTNFIVPNSAF